MYFYSHTTITKERIIQSLPNNVNGQYNISYTDSHHMIATTFTRVNTNVATWSRV